MNDHVESEMVIMCHEMNCFLFSPHSRCRFLASFGMIASSSPFPLNISSPNIIPLRFGLIKLHILLLCLSQVRNCRAAASRRTQEEVKLNNSAWH